MKPEEASQAIRDSYIPKMFNALEEALEVAIEALEKQVATKPEMYIGDYEFERWPICPKCKGELHPNGEKFCSDCGQKINWEETP